MANNPNARNINGITFVHAEPPGIRSIREIPPIYWPDTRSVIAFNVTGRRTLELPPEKAYILAMYHVALLNTLLTMGEDDREQWQPSRDVYDYMDDPKHELVSISPTALARTIDALELVTLDATGGIPIPFVERSARGSGYPVALRIYPGIGLRGQDSGEKLIENSDTAA